jgi:hypothetical protein
MVINIVDFLGDAVDSIQVCARTQGELVGTEDLLFGISDVCDTTGTPTSGQATLSLVKSVGIDAADNDTTYTFWIHDISVTRDDNGTEYDDVTYGDVVVPDSTTANLKHNLP